MIKEPQLQELKKADDRALKKVYTEYRAPFLNYARKFGLREEEILDIYQDSIIVLYENLVNDKLTELKSSIKTYLFGIGKNKIYSYLRKHKKMNVIKDNDLPKEEAELIEVVSTTSPLDEKQEKIKEALETMGSQCRKILELFYYRGLTIDEIRDSEGYKNKGTVKSQKSRCLKTLKGKILNKG